MSNKYLKKIAKGTVIMIIGFIFGMFFGLLSRILIVRIVSQEEYGIYSLSLAIYSIVSTFAMFGLNEGVARQISYNIRDSRKISNIILSSMFLIVLSGILVVFLFYTFFIDFLIFFKGVHSIYDAKFALEVLILSLPFYLLINTITSIFRGFSIVEAKVYFKDIVPKVFFLTFLVFIFFLEYSFREVLYSFLLAYILTSILALHYLRLKLKAYNFDLRKRFQPIFFESIDLIKFSFPLLFVGIMGVLISWTDTLMLGYFRSSAEVGIYNVALPLADIVVAILGASGYIYLPVASQMFSEKKFHDLFNVYQTLTKWLIIVSAPIFFLLFVFSNQVIEVLFGAEYIEAGVPLKLLLIGFISSIVWGLNALTLVAMGYTKVVGKTYTVVVFLNITLNYILIPKYGIIGAAAASMLTYLSMNIIYTYVLYKTSNIHPFSKNYFKTFTLFFILILFFKVVVEDITTQSLWQVIFYEAIFIFIFGSLIIIFRCFDENDINILKTFYKKLVLKAR